MKHKILIIDDDIELCRLLEKCLSSAGLPSVVANTGSNGMAIFEQGGYCLVVLDVMLPDINGFSLLEQIRSRDNVPILMLTAKSEENDKVKGLELGADDYLTKPFSIKEFLARIGSLIRRNTVLNYGAPGAGSEMIFNDMIIDAQNRTVIINNIDVKLTAKEFDLLHFLAANRGRIFTKKQLYSHVWNDEYAYDDSNIMSFISKLRKKIEAAPDSPEYIQTVRGVGYRFNQEV
ncbi:MAG TPA: DNA-binding response regulator [Ruminococcaceae bacterium]|nr:DNA-binding response regulator [Oscillospiraceae bacterium]